MSSITSFLWFSTEAEAASTFYVSIFKDSRLHTITRYSVRGPEPKGAVMAVEFTLLGREFIAINASSSAVNNGALRPNVIALLVDCDTQDEVDAIWGNLTDGGEPLTCGWVRDRFGVVWNIVPNGLRDVLGSDSEGAQRAMQMMQRMQKLDVNALRRACNGHEKPIFARRMGPDSR